MPSDVARLRSLLRSVVTKCEQANKVLDELAIPHRRVSVPQKPPHIFKGIQCPKCGFRATRLRIKSMTRICTDCNYVWKWEGDPRFR